MVKYACCQGCRQRRGASGARHPPFEIGASHFTFDSPAAAYIQYCILEMCPPSGLWPHHNFCGNIAKLQNDEIYHILRTSQLTYRKECWFGEIYILWQLQCSPRYLKWPTTGAICVIILLNLKTPRHHKFRTSHFTAGMLFWLNMWTSCSPGLLKLWVATPNIILGSRNKSAWQMRYKCFC